MSAIVVTGASGGLGTEVCGRLALGSTVIPLGRKDCDFHDADAVADCVKRCAAEHEPLAGIVHCAGVEVVSPLRATPAGQLGNAMAAAASAFGLLRAAAGRGVMADGASIVLMSSVAASKGSAGMVAYSAGKGAIEAMARAAAVELAPRRIRVNCIAAGAFRSPMHERITRNMPDSAQLAYAAAHPLGIGTVADVADAVLFLLGAKWVTGTVMVVDGGYLA